MMDRWRFLVGMFTVLLGVAAASAQPVPSGGLEKLYGKVRVLCVGWNRYDSSREFGYADLRFAEKDAREFRDLMKSRFEYETELLDSASGREALLGRLRAYEKELGPDDVFIFYIAAHGETIDTPVLVDAGGVTGFIVPPDARLDEVLAQKKAEVRAEHEKARRAFQDAHPDAKTDEDLAKAGLPDSASLDDARISDEARARAKSYEVYQQRCLRTSQLRDLIGRLPAKHVVMLLDSCFSGFAVLTSRGRPCVPDADDIGRYRFLKDPSRDVLTAGTAGQETYESEAWGGGHGLFTAELLKTLGETERAISVAELHSKVQSAVTAQAARANKKMLPLRHSLPLDSGHPAGQFVFVPPSEQKWREAIANAIRQKHGGDVKAAMRSAGETHASNVRRRGETATLQLLAAMMYDSRVRAGKLSHDPAITRASPRWVAWFRSVEPLAASGQPESLAALYYAYALGLGVPRNQEEAARVAQEARNTGDPVGKAVLAAALAGGAVGDQQQLVADELRKSAAAGESALGGAAVMAAAAGSRNGPALIAGAGVGLWGLLESLHDTAGKAMADSVELRDGVLPLLGESPSAPRNQELESKINRWLNAMQAVADHANRETASDFTRLAGQIVGRFNTHAKKVKELMGSDPAKAKAEFDLADEAVDQLYGLYFLCVEKPARDRKVREAGR
jgi:TPR repeat protein